MSSTEQEEAGGAHAARRALCRLDRQRVSRGKRERRFRASGLFQAVKARLEQAEAQEEEQEGWPDLSV